MDIERYVREKAKQFEKSVAAIRDLRVFDYNYVPERPLMREELKSVIDALLRYEKTNIPNHMLIVGSRGCGKTLSVLYLRRLFSERGVRVLYVNCRVHNTSFKILAHLLGVRARGVSFAELGERFHDAFSAKTVVVLDEVDLISEKDKNKDILYFLSRSKANYMTVMLSNDPKWMASVDESIQSTLQPESIYFRPYKPGEIKRILEERARIGLRKLPGRVSAEIAALTTRYTNGDVRVALKTLYYWAAERECTLEENFERARRDIVMDVLSNLNDKGLLVLKSVAGMEQPVKEAYSRYRELCRRFKEEPYSYVYFYSTLSYLQSLGLILLISTKVRRTYTKVM